MLAHRPRLITAHPAAWLPAAKGLAIGLAAALVCVAVHAPLPWMIGPLVALAACRSAGIECVAPAGGRQAGQWIIDTALGLYFTALVAELVTRMWWLFLFAAVFALALGCFCGYLVAHGSRESIAPPQFLPACPEARQKCRCSASVTARASTKLPLPSRCG